NVWSTAARRNQRHAVVARVEVVESARCHARANGQRVGQASRLPAVGVKEGELPAKARSPAGWKPALLWPQNRPRWRAVAVPDFYRQTNQLVLAGSTFRQVQALDNPDTGLQQNLMALDAVALITAHREIVHADRANPAIHHVLGGFSRDVDKACVEILLPPCPLRVARLKQDALALLESMLLQFRCSYRIVVFDFDDAAGADYCVERHRVQRRAVPDEMIQSVHVRARVGAQVQLRHVTDGTFLHIGEAFDVDGWIRGPVDHPGVQRNRDINPGFGHRILW